MAHSLSAKKRVRQNLKHRARNRARKADVRAQVKTFITTLSTDINKAEAELRKVVAVMDKVAVKGTIHKNAAARKRSRLTKRLNAARAAGGKGTAAAKA